MTKFEKFVKCLRMILEVNIKLLLEFNEDRFSSLF